MKRIAILLLCAASFAAAQSGTPVRGSIWSAQMQAKWGGVAPGSAVYVTSTGFLRDSAGQRVALDTAVYGASGWGACSQELAFQQAAGVQPNQKTILQYRVRGTSEDSSSARITVRYRWTDPVGSDTNWVDSSYYSDGSVVVAHKDISSAPTSGSTQDVRFDINATKAKVCVSRVSVGSEDTVVVERVFLRPL